jgi:raffinose/stachyose/melibiose transport system permease protein
VLGAGELATLPINLYSFASAHVYLNNRNLIVAYMVLMSLSVVAMFVVAQKQIVCGFTQGAA